MQWVAYRQKHGAIATGPRLELHLASLQAMIVQALGGKAKPSDFLTRDEKPRNESGINWEQAVQAFTTMGALSNG